MGMSIDEAINTLEYIKNNPTNDVDAQLLPEAIELFNTAIDTMRKYQKIQEIVARWKVDTWTDGVSYDCMAQINEVIDGA